MTQDFNGYLACVENLPFPDLFAPGARSARDAAGKDCMLKHGYDPNSSSVEQAMTLARRQQDYAIAHPEMTSGDILGAMFVLFIVLAFILVVGYGVRSLITQRRQWGRLPTLENYLAEHPDCRTGAGIKCASCGSKSIRNWGLSSATDSLRTFICNSCGRSLYRSADGRA